MPNENLQRRSTPLLCIVAALVAASVLAQGPLAAQGPTAPVPPPATPRTAAPIDLAGYWVAVVTEEWLWRMVTPPRGDYTSIPLSDEGRRVAGLWEPAMDGSCKAYGAAGLMRIPTRLNITWQGSDVIKVESDAGQQTRLLRFNQASPAGGRSLQGLSLASWEPLGGPAPMRNGQRIGPAPQGGTLKVVTTNLLEGWLRKNGVPYSESTTLTEFWDRVAFPNGDVWLTVSQYVNDPKYLLNEYTTSMHFKREADGSKWKPTPCRQTT